MNTRTAAFAGTLLFCASTAWSLPQDPMKSPHQDQVRRTSEIPFLLHRITELEGLDVQSTTGDDLGDLNDLLVDPQTGKIEYAVISSGTFLGMGGDLYAVPFGMLEPRKDAEEFVDEARRGDMVDLEEGEYFLVLDVPIDTLKGSPKFPPDQWPVIDQAWEQKVNTHFGETPMGTPAGTRKLVRCSEIIGVEVEGRGDEDIGDIEELAIDPKNSRIAYFVIGTGGFLGMGEKQIALPWEPAEVMFAGDDDEDLEISFPADEESLKNAPEYDKDDWKRMSDPIWLRTVYTYHSAQPYWDRAVEAGYEKRPGHDDGMDDHDDGMDDEDGGKR